MYICDMHTHSRFSFDGHSTAFELCKNAIKAGVIDLALTDHFDIDCVMAGFFPPYLASQAREELNAAAEKYAGRLNVTFGIEIGQPHLSPKEAKRFIHDEKIEYVLGSIHNLENVPDFSFLNFKQMPQTMCENLWERSLHEIIKMLDFDGLHAVAHITYPIRYMKLAGRTIELEKFYPLLEKVFTKMIEREVSLEVNTSGLRQGMGCTLPDYDIIRLYNQCGGKLITCGSDAHKAKKVGADISLVINELSKIGFEHITAFSCGKKVQIDITEYSANNKNTINIGAK